MIFFFQAEDGIRDDLVTGVQTCALPIYAALGFTGGTLTPNSNPLTIYNHGTTQVASIDIAGNITSSGSFLAANGTAAVPSYAFTNSAATGLYRGGTDILGVGKSIRGY